MAAFTRHPTPTVPFRPISDTVPTTPKNRPNKPRNPVRIKSEQCPIWIGLLSELNRNHCPICPGIRNLTLDQLNDASQPWAELEYNRKVHSELGGQTPLARFLAHKNVARPCPSAQTLQRAFTIEVRRTQRRSDGTLTLEGIRFEVPSRFGHMTQLWLRYASWDLSTVHLADPKTGALLCRLYPVDKTKNAEGLRAPRTSAPAQPPPAPTGMAPLLQKIIRQYATTGLPPAYLPQPVDPPNPPSPA